MTQQQQQKQGGAVVGGWPRQIVATAGLLAGALAVYAIGLDSLWPVLMGAIVTAALVAAVDFGLSRAAIRIGRHMKVSQLALLIAIAAGVGLFFRAERNQAFNKAFGLSPPPGVSRVDIEHLLAKETGRKLTVVQFQASPSALDALVTQRPFVQDTKVSVKPGKEAKAQRSLWGRAFRQYGDSVDDKWKTRLPVLDPVIYHWVGTERETLGQQTSVLWDASSGRGCAIHSSS